jgi:hypothetical protein
MSKECQQELINLLLDRIQKDINVILEGIN